MRAQSFSTVLRSAVLLIKQNMPAEKNVLLTV